MKIILWGHKLHSHTHSYIHYGFYRAFKKLGYEVYWVDNSDDISGLSLSNSIFITECQVDQKIPIRNDCYYVLHNCDLLPESYIKYLPVVDRCLSLRKFSRFPNDLPKDSRKIGPYTFFKEKGRILIQPWATDMLPEEIDLSLSRMQVDKSKGVVFIGTIGSGEYGNIEQISPFKRECDRNGINFIHKTRLEPDEAILLTKESFLSPAIVGRFQLEYGYIACRIFKAISCGRLGITNSWEEFDIMDGLVTWNQNTTTLFYDALRDMDNTKTIESAMKLVKDKHTYLNRISTILEVMGITT